MTFEEAYEAYTRHLIKVACGLTGNLPDAEDLVSGTWLKLYPRWAIIEDRNIRGYCVTVLRHLHIDTMRATHPTVSIDTAPDWTDDGRPGSDYLENGVSLDAIVESRDRYRRVLVALMILSKTERRAVVNAATRQGYLRDGHENGNAERVALHRARKHLREAVA